MHTRCPCHRLSSCPPPSNIDPGPTRSDAMRSRARFHCELLPGTCTAPPPPLNVPFLYPLQTAAQPTTLPAAKAFYSTGAPSRLSPLHRDWARGTAWPGKRLTNWSVRGLLSFTLCTCGVCTSEIDTRSERNSYEPRAMQHDELEKGLLAEVPTIVNVCASAKPEATPTVPLSAHAHKPT